jgi:cytochrome P450
MNKEITGSLMDPATQQCPFPMYKEMREHAPVHYIEDMGIYMVTSYDLLMEVMRNPKIYSNLAPEGQQRAGISCDEAERIISEEGYGRNAPSIVNNDAPGHTFYRSLVERAFRAGRIRQMEEYINETVTGLIDKVVDKPEWDAVVEMAVPVPMYVIADQLGVPRDDFKKFKKWSDAWVIGLGLPVPDEKLIEAAKLVVEMQHYMIARMLERRENPEDDMLSDLAQCTYEDGTPIEDNVLLSMIEQILVAGNETTTNGIANGILQMADDQELQSRLRDNPKEVKTFVEEILRYESPVQGLFRYSTEETVLGDVTIPKASTLMIRYAAGNRDESKFEEGDSFNVDRRNSGAHLAFGSGIHHCVGSQLARAEMIAVFRAMLERFSKFELAVPRDDLQYHFSFALRGPQSIPLKLTAA